MVKTWRCSALLAVLFLAGAALAEAEPRHGLAMQGEPALPKDFQHLPYANPSAPQGGVLRQVFTGSFDSVNPFIVKGEKATSVNTYVFESMMTRNYAEPFTVYGLLAQSIDVTPDRSRMTFVLRPEARFSDGTPVMIDVDSDPVFADPQAAITWSSGVTTSVKANVKMKDLIGKGSGEQFQMAFGGQGWVLVQPSEGQIKAVSSGSSSSGSGGLLGSVMGS